MNSYSPLKGNESNMYNIYPEDTRGRSVSVESVGHGLDAIKRRLSRCSFDKGARSSELKGILSDLNIRNFSEMSELSDPSTTNRFYRMQTQAIALLALNDYEASDGKEFPENSTFEQIEHLQNFRSLSQKAWDCVFGSDATKALKIKDKKQQFYKKEAQKTLNILSMRLTDKEAPVMILQEINKMERNPDFEIALKTPSIAKQLRRVKSDVLTQSILSRHTRSMSEASALSFGSTLETPLIAIPLVEVKAHVQEYKRQYSSGGSILPKRDIQELEALENSRTVLEKMSDLICGKKDAQTAIAIAKIWEQGSFDEYNAPSVRTL